MVDVFICRLYHIGNEETEMFEKTQRSCTDCRNCEKLCPSSAITMLDDAEGFLIPHVSTKRCTQCEVCVHRCMMNHFPSNYKIAVPPSVSICG